MKRRHYLKATELSEGSRSWKTTSYHAGMPSTGQSRCVAARAAGRWSWESITYWFRASFGMV